jgi:hypothetical protein
MQVRFFFLASLSSPASIHVLELVAGNNDKVGPPPPPPPLPLLFLLSNCGMGGLGFGGYVSIEVSMVYGSRGNLGEAT